MNFKNYIDEILDFPKKGISFKDITPILKNPKIFKHTINEFIKIVKKIDVEKIVAIDSRGFIFGSVVAYEMGLPFILVRKKGKLPKLCLKQSYGLEYGIDEMEIQKEDIKKGDKIVIIDDLLATGGTALVAKNLVEKLGGIVKGVIFLIELKFLKGKEKLENISVKSLVTY